MWIGQWMEQTIKTHVKWKKQDVKSVAIWFRRLLRLWLLLHAQIWRPSSVVFFFLLLAFSIPENTLASSQTLCSSLSMAISATNLHFRLQPQISRYESPFLFLLCCDFFFPSSSSVVSALFVAFRLPFGCCSCFFSSSFSCSAMSVGHGGVFGHLSLSLLPPLLSGAWERDYADENRIQAENSRTSLQQFSRKRPTKAQNATKKQPCNSIQEQNQPSMQGYTCLFTPQMLHQNPESQTQVSQAQSSSKSSRGDSQSRNNMLHRARFRSENSDEYGDQKEQDINGDD
ncbi:hypothetical protein Cgig2_031528 [Carnegiea gigantea]|uniref:Uncharacterized protein n=1 Tax=Carnegiea gigantea TaxID=171969 RepID=A0A9Q1QC11_9CARY|nr:hypothetical protein Cgig2_031528 [Carnegiea gigantea]